MELNLTEEHRMVQRMMREFAQKEVAPVIGNGSQRKWRRSSCR
jgi:hypothetical protein